MSPDTQAIVEAINAAKSTIWGSLLVISGLLGGITALLWGKK